MKRLIRIFYLAAVLPVSADIITPPGKPSMECTILRYSSGMLEFKDDRGIEKRGGIKYVQEIQFESPQISRVSGRNGTVMTGQVLLYSNGSFTFVSDEEKTYSIPVQNILSIDFNIAKWEPKPLVSTGETFEQIQNFPEEYLGKRIVFTHCEVDEKPNRDNGMFYIGVRSSGGARISAYPHLDDVCFVVDKQTAHDMTDVSDSSSYWINCSIECELMKVRAFGDHCYYFAIIHRFDILNAGGKHVATFLGKPEYEMDAKGDFQTSLDWFETEEGKSEFGLFVKSIGMNFQSKSNEAKLETGDVILSVELDSGKPIAPPSRYTDSNVEFNKALKGKFQSVLKLKVKRNGVAEPFVVEVVRNILLKP